MLRRPLKTLRQATGPIVSCMGAATAPQEDFENHLAITLKTRTGATAPIVSSMGAAKAPKGTKKPVLTPGIMRNHAQFAPGA